MEASKTVWSGVVGQIKALVPWLHGHQATALGLFVLGLFVLGVVRAGSVRLPVVAEGLADTSSATTPSIERRLARFLANGRVPVARVWAALLPHLLAWWRQQVRQQGPPALLVLDLTPIDQRASVVYLGLLIHTRLLPLAWAVLPGETPWDEGQWAVVARLFAQVAPHLAGVSCTLVADRGLSSHALVQLCQEQGWHYVLRLRANSCVQPSRGRARGRWVRVSRLLGRAGQSWYGQAQVWVERPVAGTLSAVWDATEQEPWYLLSDLPAGRRCVTSYRRRMRVEATFQDTKGRGWDLEGTHTRDLARLDRLLLVLGLALWWVAHLAADCLHHGQRRRFDRADRRDKGLFRLGRAWAAHLLTSQAARARTALLPFRATPAGWHLTLRF
jgi:hypothetical protein